MHESRAPFALISPPVQLYERILLQLAQMRQRRARVWLAVQTVGCFAWGAALVPTAHYFGSELYASGFSTYFSLLLSDHAAIPSWRPLFYSLIESIPSIALILLLALVGAFGWSLYQAASHVRVAFATPAV